MHTLQAVFSLLLIFAAIFLGVWFSTRRSAEIIDQWAKDNSFTILTKERRLLAQGPFFFRANRSQTVYYVTLRDHSGQTRSAYLRCGSWYLGLLSNTINVKWDS
jgi:hypothetical protein